MHTMLGHMRSCDGSPFGQSGSPDISSGAIACKHSVHPLKATINRSSSTESSSPLLPNVDLRCFGDLHIYGKVYPALTINAQICTSHSLDSSSMDADSWQHDRIGMRWCGYQIHNETVDDSLDRRSAARAHTQTACIKPEFIAEA